MRGDPVHGGARVRAERVALPRAGERGRPGLSPACPQPSGSLAPNQPIVPKYERTVRPQSGVCAQSRLHGIALMLHQEVALRLLDLELFRGLGRPQVTAIARSGERMLFRPGHKIVRAGLPGDAAYLLLAGDASAVGVDGHSLPIEPGSLIGELAMLIDHDYAVTVVCNSQVRAIRLGRDLLESLMVTDPDIADHFVARLSSRLKRVASELRRIDQMLARAGEGTSAPHAP